MTEAAMRRPDGGPLRALVVEDEDDLREALTALLEGDGWAVRAARTGGSGEVIAEEFGPDAVVLDINLPDASGFDVFHRLRALDPRVCVLFLTARAGEQDRVTGISIGADDYVTKPFSSAEVLARLRGLVRRAGRSADTGTTLAVGDLTLDEMSREVRRGDEPIELTVTEYELLRYLMANARRVLTKDQILERVWKYDFGGTAHIVELYISYLRKKIDRAMPGRAPLIHTVRGVGYVLKPEP